MEIKELIKEAHQNAVDHGFWEAWYDVDQLTNYNGRYEDIDNWHTVTMLMLIVSELAEAQEGLRHNDMDNFKEELADVAIRLADLCGGLDIDLESEIKKKMEINKSRPYKHGKEF